MEGINSMGFGFKRSKWTWKFLRETSYMRNEELRTAVVKVSPHSWVWTQFRRWHAPCGICTLSLSERTCLFVIIMCLEQRETSYTSLRMRRNTPKCMSKSLCGFLRFGQPSTSDFLWLSKGNVFPIVQSVLKIQFFNNKKSRWTCDFETS